MPTRHWETSTAGRRISVERKGVASLLFALARPTDAKASLLDGRVLRLTLPIGSREIEVGEIDTVEVQTRWRWGGLEIHTASGRSTVSGLSRRDASRLASALEDARIGWWRHALSAAGGGLLAAAAGLQVLSRPETYVRGRLFKAMRDGAANAVMPFTGCWPDGLAGSPELSSLKRLRGFLADPEAARTRANEAFVADELERSRAFLDAVESRPLTCEQRRAVAVDDDHNLVVAAAGSGKTSLMVAKAGWLIERGTHAAGELLLLAFGRNARDELAERVAERLGGTARDMDVRTFHELGLAIIGDVEGRRPTLAKWADDRNALHEVLDGIVGALLEDPDHGAAVVRWLAYGFAPYRSPHEFRHWGDYLDYIRSHEIRSLNGDRVKSFEECRIANFLYLNGIPYEYERVYQHDTATAKKGQYKPDFHLTESGIYIEHFALSESGNTPPFIDRDDYTASREWKLAQHAKYGTTLIETFSHEQRAGELMQKLARELRTHGVEPRPLPREKVFARLNEQGRVAPFTRLVATFLQHFKGSRLSPEDVLRRTSDSLDPRRAEAFLAVYQPILERYEEHLSESGEIDFDDMVNRATDHMAAGRWKSPYRYVLIDEFQDVSAGRAAMLKALLGRPGGAQLFAVGDDWQAIYRFAGADIAIMRAFEAEFGGGTRSALETTFRCSDGVSGAATRFVLSNAAQVARGVRTRRSVEGPGIWIGLAGEEGTSPLGEALERIAADAPADLVRPEVLLLGRYRHLRPDLGALRRGHPGLDLSYSTVHGAKGREADYVVVLELNAGQYGFPSEVADDPLLDLVLAEPENHPNAEERRLLYVAMTRARYRAYLLVERRTPSRFARELTGQDGVGTFGRPVADDIACPGCGTGRLVRRRGEGGRTFYGCSNYPYCERTERPCPACGVGLRVRESGTVRCRECGATDPACPACDGVLVARRSRHGHFLGCSNYPACRYTRERRGNRAGSHRSGPHGPVDDARRYG